MDSNRRIIDYMRVSITDRCNLRCRYCMPENVPFVPHKNILRYEEILWVCRAAAGLGIRNLKVTGGEPLVRKGCTELMKEMKAIPGIEHVTLTTNAVLLEKHLPALCELGVDSINISLDTLKLCLCHSDGVDLRALLRSEASEEELRLAMEGAILQKPARHRFGEIPTMENYFMSQIGG